MTQLDLLGTIEATQVSPDVHVVTGRGAIDGRVACELRDALIPIAGADGARVVVDLTDAHGFDDDILDVLSRAAHLSIRHGERLTLVGAGRSVTERVRACGLADIVDVRLSEGGGARD